MNNSTDEYKSYLKVIFITVFSILLFLIPITYKALFIDKIFSHKNLWEYQMSRLDSNPDIDTLFLGDSSLRYAIDSDYFNSLSGLNSINLGLTLNHGFAGSYNVLKRAINKNQIKNVIIVNTIEILKTEISYKGYFHSINSIDDLVSLSQNEKSKILAVIFSIFTNKDNLKKIFNFYLHKDVSLNFFTEEDLRPKKEKIDLKTFQNYRAWAPYFELQCTAVLSPLIFQRPGGGCSYFIHLASSSSLICLTVCVVIPSIFFYTI